MKQLIWNTRVPLLSQTWQFLGKQEQRAAGKPYNRYHWIPKFMLFMCFHDWQDQKVLTLPVAGMPVAINAKASF